MSLPNRISVSIATSNIRIESKARMLRYEPTASGFRRSNESGSTLVIVRPLESTNRNRAFRPATKFLNLVGVRSRRLRIADIDRLYANVSDMFR